MIISDLFSSVDDYNDYTYVYNPEVQMMTIFTFLLHQNLSTREWLCAIISGAKLLKLF